jgi:hypothetical protein
VNRILQLASDVEDARDRYLNSVRILSSAQGSFKPSPDEWSAAEITEHLVHAEYGGISGIWKALDGSRRSDPPWSGDHVNRGLSIEEIVARTWKPREEVPVGAGPRLGGPLAFWIAALESCRQLLDRIAGELAGEDLERIVYPHPISGPLDAGQRFEFLRFHMDRHTAQVDRLRQHPEFP